VGGSGSTFPIEAFEVYEIVFAENADRQKEERQNESGSQIEKGDRMRERTEKALSEVKGGGTETNEKDKDGGQNDANDVPLNSEKTKKEMKREAEKKEEKKEEEHVP
jgi:hypothetical protein